MNSKTLNRRAFLKGAALSLGVAALAGCAPKVVEKIVKETVVVEKEKEVEKVIEKTVVVEKVKDVVILRMHSRLGDAQRAVYNGGIERMQQANPQVKVNVEEFPAGSAEYGPKIAALVAGGAVGDITWNAIGSGSFQFLAGNKALAALDDLVAADSSDFTLDAFYPRVVNGFRLGPGGQGTGELMGLPTLAHGCYVLLFYNRDLVEKEGLQPPTDDWTRDQLIELGKKLTKEGRFGFLPTTGGYSELRSQTLPYGGEIISADGTKSQLEDEKVKQGLRWVYDCFFTYKVAPTAQQIAGGVGQMFLAGQLGGWQSGGWDVVTCRTVVKDTFKWDMVLMSKGPAGNGGGHLHADSFAVTSASKNKPLAYELIKFMTDKEAGVGFASMMGLACRFDVFKDARITKDPMLVKIGKTTEDAFDHLGSANLRKQELQTTVSAIFGPVWTGDKKPDDAFFAEASKTLQTFLDKKFD